MSIKVVDGPQIVLTREEYERLQREYQRTVMHMVNAPSFETWVRRQKRRGDDSNGRTP